MNINGEFSPDEQIVVQNWFIYDQLNSIDVDVCVRVTLETVGTDVHGYKQTEVPKTELFFLRS